MTSYRVWIACSLFALAGFVLSDLSQSQLVGQAKATEYVPAKWEYKSLKWPADDVKGLNELGDQGWELTAVDSNTGTTSSLYFKRKK